MQIVAFGGAGGAFAAIIGLILDHLWARCQNEKASKRQEHRSDFQYMIAGPLDLHLDKLVDLRSDVSEWARRQGVENADSLCSKGIRLNRALNRFLNEAGKCPSGGGRDWPDLPTVDFESALINLHEERKELSSKTLERVIRELEEALSDLRQRLRP
ncbi:unnamed protein product [Hapterophycus canaliculatus]